MKKAEKQADQQTGTVKKKYSLDQAFEMLLNDSEINYFTRRTWLKKNREGRLNEGKKIDILVRYGWDVSVKCILK